MIAPANRLARPPCPRLHGSLERRSLDYARCRSLGPVVETQGKVLPRLRDGHSGILSRSEGTAARKRGNLAQISIQTPYSIHRDWRPQRASMLEDSEQASDGQDHQHSVCNHEIPVSAGHEPVASQARGWGLYQNFAISKMQLTLKRAGPAPPLGAGGPHKLQAAASAKALAVRSPSNLCQVCLGFFSTSPP